MGHMLLVHVDCYKLSPMHTADDDETKLFCRVASASAVCT